MLEVVCWRLCVGIEVLTTFNIGCCSQLMFLPLYLFSAEMPAYFRTNPPIHVRQSTQRG